MSSFSIGSPPEPGSSHSTHEDWVRPIHHQERRFLRGSGEQTIARTVLDAVGSKRRCSSERTILGLLRFFLRHAPVTHLGVASVQ